MWSGPLHDVEFTNKVLEHVQANSDKYGTSARMKGMLTVAKEVRARSSQSYCSSPSEQTYPTMISQLIYTFPCLC